METDGRLGDWMEILSRTEWALVWAADLGWSEITANLDNCLALVEELLSRELDNPPIMLFE
jgi:hypothetical protein